MKYITSLKISSILLLLMCIGCTKNNTDTTATNSSAPSMEATFKKVNDDVEANLKISGLQPNTQHGLHIHMRGECYGPDFKSAGDHFNPLSKSHGAPGSGSSHLGDLGNISADRNGSFTGTVKISGASADGPNSILHRSLIVHQKSDDLNSQPAGNSGYRIACVVINSID
jgi:superoxide dismutase, Cu-Zn family